MNIGMLPFDRLDEFAGFIDPDMVDLLSSGDECVLLAAEEDGAPAGLLAAENDNDNIRIASLFVAPERRLRGIGSALLDALVLCSLQMRGDVTCSYLSDEPSAFFKRRGFTAEPNPYGAGAYATTLARLSANPFFSQDMPRDDRITPLTPQNEHMLLRYITRYCAASGVYTPPFPPSRVRGELCRALVAGGEIQGLVLCGVKNGGAEILWLHVNPAYAKAMPALLRGVFHAFRSHIDPTAPVYFHVVNEAAHRLADRFAGDTFIPQYEAAARLNALRFTARVRRQGRRVLGSVPEWFILETGGAEL